jgi:tRNA (adenine37-N6)-methyltransferase
MEMNTPLRVIGVVRSAYADPGATPIQAALNRAERGIIEIGHAYQDGLDGLNGFDYAWLLTWLHRAGASDEPVPLRQVPFLLRRRRQMMGLFATRSPRRVNPIGLSLIQILDIAGTRIRFAGVDLVDNTPVIDIKPYVTRFDRPETEPRCGWYDQVPMTDGATPERLDSPAEAAGGT